MYTNFPLPYITSPSQVTPRSQTLTDNTFFNIIDEETNSANLTTAPSNHYVQFSLFKDEQIIYRKNKDVKFTRDFKHLNKENFGTDMKNTQWDKILEIIKECIDLYFEMYFKTFNNSLGKHLSVRNLSIEEKILSRKPWITTRILNFIKNKNRKYRKCLKAKDATRENSLHNEFKTYRNKLATVKKARKSIHYRYSLKLTTQIYVSKTWDGIREVINIKKGNP